MASTGHVDVVPSAESLHKVIPQDVGGLADEPVHVFASSIFWLGHFSPFPPILLNSSKNKNKTRSEIVKRHFFTQTFEGIYTEQIIFNDKSVQNAATHI